VVAKALPEAREVFFRAVEVWIAAILEAPAAWFATFARNANGLELLSAASRPLTQDLGWRSPMNNRAFVAWVSSEGAVRARDFQKIRPYVLV